MMHFERMITCIDAHTGGEPLRIITSGLPPIYGKTILEKRKYMKEHHDDIRKMMMLEPRGHSGMYGYILVPPVTEDADLGVLFTHNEGLSTMCGHAVIAVTKVALEVGMIQAKEGENIVKIDAPPGRITAYADVENKKVKNVRFENVPSFVYKKDIVVNVDGIGDVVCDVVFCGAFYVYVDVDKVGLKVDPKDIDALVKVGMEMKYKVMDAMEIVHPLEPGLNGIYGTIFLEPLVKEGNKVITKNVCIFAEGQIDRSPTGSGTAGRLALHAYNGELKEGETLVNYSIIDTPMEGKILSRTEVDGYKAVVPEVSGTAHIMGFNQLVLDPEDPLPEGFRIIGG